MDKDKPDLQGSKEVLILSLIKIMNQSSQRNNQLGLATLDELKKYTFGKYFDSELEKLYIAVESKDWDKATEIVSKIMVSDL